MKVSTNLLILENSLTLLIDNFKKYILIEISFLNGLLLKVGNRKGRRYYRIYTGHQNNSLRFEAELKGDLIKDFHDLLIASTFDQQDFETRLSYQYFKYSFELFSPSIHTSHLDWLFKRIRPLQFKNTFLLDRTASVQSFTHIILISLILIR